MERSSRDADLFLGHFKTRSRASPASGDERVGNPSLATDAQAWRGPCGPPASRGPATPPFSALAGALEIAQDVVEDAAVAEVLGFVRRVDADPGLEADLIGAVAGRGDGHRLRLAVLEL
jgi:hypothetical protein